MTRDEWIAYGVKHKYASTPYCDTHEGAKLTDEEEALLESGADFDEICLIAMRLNTDV